MLDAAGARGAVREPLVRTVHSYAFAVLRLAAQRNGDPPPRLITSAEQDGIIRELLAGDLEDGADALAAGAASGAGDGRRSPPNCVICWRGAPNAAWTRWRCSGSAGCPARPEWVAAGRFAARPTNR